MKAWKKWTIILLVLGFAGATLFFIKGRLDQKISSSVSVDAKSSAGQNFYEHEGLKYLETNWKELVQLDYESGEKTPTIRALENQRVRIPGYIVPLSDEAAVLDEFLFVPNDQACIHVPPPPPNLIIKAKLKTKLSFESIFNPSWLMGKLEIVPTKSQFGSAAYQIMDAELEKYEESN